MTYAEALPIMQQAFAMLKKEILVGITDDKSTPEDFVNAAMAEDVIVRAITKALREDRADKTREIDAVRYSRLKSFLNKMST